MDKDRMVTARNYEPTDIFDPRLGGINKFGFFQCIHNVNVTSRGIFPVGYTVFDYPFLLFLIQVAVISGLTRGLVDALKVFRQPSIVAQILGGVLLGPWALGGIRLPNAMPKLGSLFFQGRSFITLDGIANLGLVYYLFLVGLGTDPTAIKRAGKKACLISTASLAIPFVIALALSNRLFPDKNFTSPCHILLAFVSSTTSVPVLSRILIDAKLHHTEIGRLATSFSALSDACTWALFVLFCSLSDSTGTQLNPQSNNSSDTHPPAWAIVVVLSLAILFTCFCFLVVRPTALWLAWQTPEGEKPSATHKTMVIIGLVAAGIVADTIGVHPAFGSFVYGLALPYTPLTAALTDNTEAYVCSMLLPLFFAAIGMKTDVSELFSVSRDQAKTLMEFAGVFIATSMVKLATVTLLSMSLTRSASEGLLLGILANSKGALEMLVMYIGMDKGLLSTDTLTVMVMMTLATAALVLPGASLVYKPWRRKQVGYKRRNIQRLRPDSELRMLACVHNARNVPSIIGLLSASNPTKRSPMFVYALHLMELTGRDTNMLIAHHTDSKRGGKGNGDGMVKSSEKLFAALENYEQHAGGVSVQQITVVSPYATMHEDVCAIAGDKHAALVILPFHRDHQSHDTSSTSAACEAIRAFNARVSSSVPCSVGLLIDRGGLGGAARFAMGGQLVARHIAMVFIGGADDREALAYAWRMAGNPGIRVTVIRLIAGSTAASAPATKGSKKYTAIVDADREKEIDEEYVREFRLENAGSEAMAYMEMVVNSSSETVAAIREINSIHDLYVVGKGEGRWTPLTEGMEEICEYPELGPIGDFLASSDLGRMVSVLVMHHRAEAVGALPMAAVAPLPMAAVAPVDWEHQV